MKIHQGTQLTHENLFEEIKHMENSRVILLVISGNNYDLGMMTLAGHLIGLQARLVLYIHKLSNEATINQNKARFNIFQINQHERG